MILSIADYVALGGMIITTGGTIFGYLHKVRTNDLRHLDEALKRIEDKLDDHMRDHAQGLFQ